MHLSIRFDKLKKSKKSIHKIVVIDSRKAIGKKYLEVVGRYLQKAKTEKWSDKLLDLNVERIKVRLSQGAQISNHRLKEYFYLMYLPESEIAKKIKKNTLAYKQKNSEKSEDSTNKEKS